MSGLASLSLHAFPCVCSHMHCNCAAGGLSKEYKTKFRSLVFNLKDVNNPDLRARVLQVRCVIHSQAYLPALYYGSRRAAQAWLSSRERLCKHACVYAGITATRHARACTHTYTHAHTLTHTLTHTYTLELRAQGELTPDALVLLSTTELASRQLSAWRQQKEEEFAKAKFLDEGGGGCMHMLVSSAGA